MIENDRKTPPPPGSEGGGDDIALNEKFGAVPSPASAFAKASADKGGGFVSAEALAKAEGWGHEMVKPCQFSPLLTSPLWGRDCPIFR